MMTNAVATIIIPCGLMHVGLLPRALASCEAQSLRVDVLHMVDEKREYPARLRNRMAVQAATPFVVFLDADDYLEPDAIEVMLRHYTKAGTYVYPDYFVDGLAHNAPPELPFWCGIAHAVTTLFPRQAFLHLGGFDINHPAEDADFYLRAMNAGLCPVYCDTPCFHYTADGERSRTVVNSGKLEAIRRDLYERHRESKGKLMCCGNPDPTPPQNPGQWFDGAVYARSLYTPMGKIGPSTGRVYPRPMFQGDTILVHRDDVNARPDWWQAVVTPESITPDVDSVLRLADKSRTLPVTNEDLFESLPKQKAKGA